MSKQIITSDVLQSLCVGDGEICALMRDSFKDATPHDWLQTPLGPVEQWPQSLRTTLSIILSTPQPMLLFWGCDLVQFYNDAYAAILGVQKYPPSIRQRGCDCWAEIWQILEPQIDHVFTEAQEICHENQLVCFNRNGYSEEIYFTYSYSPVRDETKGVGGVLVVCTETTQRVLSDRRLQTLQELNANVMQTQIVEKACEIAIDSLSINPYDIPFALLYLVENNGEQAKLISTTGIEKGTDASPMQVNLTQNHVWGLAEVCQTGEAMVVDDLQTRFNDLPGGVWHTPPSSALVMPIRQHRQHTIAALLVMGISPRQVFDDQYRGFFDLVVNSVATAFANARTHEVEHQQAEALAESHHAQTDFFSNVSHEFRTQFNLILGTVENALADTEAPLLPKQRDRLEIVQRNSLQLLKQVNTLLDFSHFAQQQTEAIAARLSHILESMTDAFVALDQDWRIIYQNAAAERVNNGKPRSQVLGKTHWEEWPASVGSALEHNYRNAMTQQVSMHFEHRYYSPPDYDIWLEIHAYPTKEGLGIFFRDITEQKQAQAALVASKNQLQQQLAEIEAIYQSAPIGLNVLDTNLRFVRINQRLAEINGFSVEAHIGSTVRELLPDLGDVAEKLLYPILETGEPLLNVEITGETPAQPGVQRTWLEHFLPLKNGDQIIGISTVCEEITERKQANERIQASLREKEVLLKEIHHRVKNNLGIVSSLLQMQSRRSHDPEINKILRESQNRITSIALVHEKLYFSKDFANINFAQYISNLTSHLFASYNIKSNQIKLSIQVEDVSLDIDTAIPCGMIINELISNALKYAFPGDRAGEIQIQLFYTSKTFEEMHPGNFTLIVRDHGIGLPDNFNITKAKTLGLNLVQGLVKQIHGTIEINCQQGTEFKITFTKPMPVTSSTLEGGRH